MEDFSQSCSFERTLHDLENQLFQEKNAPSLLEQLHVQQYHVSVSGLKDSDYHEIKDPVGGSVRVSKTSTIPIELQERTKAMRQNCLMGIFSEIDRIWLTVDSDLFIWNYENGSDLAYYDGCSDTILAVELIKPKPNVFNSCIHYLLCLVGQVEIQILGVTVCGYRNNTLEVVPEPIFRIATDNQLITTVQDINGRIILGTKSGDILEISYWTEKPSWFKLNQSSVYSSLKYAREIDNKLCAKVLNHSTWKLSVLLPNIIVNGLMINEPIVQIATDPSRNMFYTRSDNSLIAQYELLPNDGVRRLGYINEENFVTKAWKNVKSVEKNQFRNIIELCPLGIGYGPLQLMAVTQSGVRLYFMDNLQLCHIRMPPANQSGTFGKMNNVRLCCESRGSVLMVCGTSIENQALYTISPDAFLLPDLVETLSVSWTHGSSWFLMPLDKNDNKKHNSNTIIQTQHLDPMRRFLMISIDSIVHLELPNPIHHLREILERNTTPQCPQIKTWINHYGPDETIYAALVIASDKRNSFLSSKATEMVLYYLNESIKSRASSYQIHGYKIDQINPLHQALLMYAARILRPLWDNCIAEYYKPNSQESYVISTHDYEELSWFLHHLNHLNDFIRENYPRLKSIDMMKTSNLHSVPNSLSLELLELLKITIEVVGLWRMLAEHEFHKIYILLSPEIQNELMRCPVKQLLLPNKRSVLVSLISALLQYYLSDGASTNSIIDALRNTCPDIYCMEDALCSRANEILISIDNLTFNKSMEPDMLERKKEHLLIEAIQLYEQVGPGIDLGSVISRLRAVGCTWGAVHLCLYAAKIRDPEDYSFKCWNEGHRPLTTIETNATEGRSDAYKYLLECLSNLLEISKSTASSNRSSISKQGDYFDASSLFPNNEVRNNALNDLKVILNTIFERKDDQLAHFEVYSWMIDNNMTNEILKFNSDHLELYLRKRLESDPQNVEAKNLLWKHYELQNRLLESAKVLDNLAVTECSNFGLDERLECISRSIVFLRAVIGGNESYEIDYLKELEDKVEIIHLQKMIIEEMGDQHGAAKNELNSRLYPVYQLLVDFVERYGLTISKLSILRVNGQIDNTNIRLIWEEIIEKEINKINEISSKETQEVSLKTAMMQICDKFKDSPTFLPLDLILSHLESYCDDNNFSDDWVISCFVAIDIPIAVIIQGYFEVIKMKDQNIRRHLNRVYNSLCLSFDQFLYKVQDMRERHLYSSRFLDVITVCLMQLQCKSDAHSLDMIERFRSYQQFLEDNI